MARKAFAFILALTLISSCAHFALADEAKFYIEVDCTSNIVTVYTASDKTVVRQMVCSTGTNHYNTPHGTFYMPKLVKDNERNEWYEFEDGYGKYGTRFYNHYLFHSYLYNTPNDDDVRWESYAAMGTSASHGCIRLYVEDAKWISENCAPGTCVKVYDSGKEYLHLKEKLYEATYTIDSGMTYAQFMSLAASEDEIGYASSGENVKELQTRLHALGLYSGSIDGVYDENMVDTVSAVQSALGMTATGVADAEFMDAINSDNAPASFAADLKGGDEGTAVKAVQYVLSCLGLYYGEINGSYDAETARGVAMFQRYVAQEPSGSATADIQEKMLNTLSSLYDLYGESGYSVAFTVSDDACGIVNTSDKLNVRQYNDGTSTVITRLEPGQSVSIIGRSGTWYRVNTGKYTGFVKCQYITPEARSLSPIYSAAESAEAAVKPADCEITLIASAKETYATVDTEERLYIREAPDSDAKMLFMLAPGAEVRVLATDGAWSQILYGGKVGYTKSSMLKKYSVRRLEASSTRIDHDSDIAALVTACAAMYVVTGYEKDPEPDKFAIINADMGV